MEKAEPERELQAISEDIVRDGSLCLFTDNWGEAICIVVDIEGKYAIFWCDVGIDEGHWEQKDFLKYARDGLMKVLVK